MPSSIWDHVCHLLTRVIGRRYEVRGQSMTPTLRPGMRVTASRLPVCLGRLRRGDVVVVKPPTRAERLEIKRILGLPNETVSWSGGRIQVDHRPLEEPYAHIPAQPPGDDEVRIVTLGPAPTAPSPDARFLGLSPGASRVRMASDALAGALSPPP